MSSFFRETAGNAVLHCYVTNDGAVEMDDWRRQEETSRV